MIENISLIAQSALKIKYNDMIIYFDPYLINKESLDADIIFITHSHYDHYSPEDIKKIKKENTKIIIPYDLEDKVKELSFNDIILVKPNEEYKVNDIVFNTVRAYNINKDFHKKDYNWVGYIINLNGEKIYVAGDTDNISELHNIKVDIAFVPVGGTYTMTSDEAVDLIKIIKPKIAVPIHYKTIVGDINDAYNFKDKLNNIVDVRILMK